MAAKADAIPVLHAVTDDEVMARAGFVDAARRMVEAGGSKLALHLRAPRSVGRLLYDAAAALRPSTRDHGALLIVNDRVDVALAADADGVQVGARGMPAADVRGLIGVRWLGLSVHGMDEARAAAAAGADWLVAGTIWPSASHPDRPGAGVDSIHEMAADGVSVIAIGGVTAERAGDARRAGASGVAAIRGLWDADDPARAVDDYLRAWSGVDV